MSPAEAAVTIVKWMAEPIAAGIAQLVRGASVGESVDHAIEVAANKRAAERVPGFRTSGHE